MLLFVRNSATDTVKQELMFAGQESGKLLAIRDIIRKVSHLTWGVEAPHVGAGFTQHSAVTVSPESEHGAPPTFCPGLIILMWSLECIKSFDIPLPPPPPPLTSGGTVGPIPERCTYLQLLLPLRVQGFSPPVLVFVQSRERAKELFHELIYDGLNVEVIHSERTQAQRDNIIKCFRSGKVSDYSIMGTCGEDQATQLLQ